MKMKIEHLAFEQLEGVLGCAKQNSDNHKSRDPVDISFVVRYPEIHQIAVYNSVANREPESQ